MPLQTLCMKLNNLRQERKTKDVVPNSWFLFIWMTTEFHLVPNMSDWQTRHQQIVLQLFYEFPKRTWPNLVGAPENFTIVNT